MCSYTSFVQTCPVEQQEKKHPDSLVNFTELSKKMFQKDGGPHCKGQKDGGPHCKGQKDGGPLLQRTSHSAKESRKPQCS
ncbi:hypothetical protein A6R68_08185 [Neotoma lepida]|uniref:Uncharacterized protein n=1 Tax=Neotoma lepida TaxID=56216 RepID=A0A1A6G4F2_NEOLE|nr:hypothetical protein A6R68_08185 [Neotoma lepida]